MRPQRIAFVHPDLGIGGAERLVVDAAVGLQALGHQVTIHTAHHDPGRCLEETRDGTLDVRVHGRRLPRSIWGRLIAPCAIARTLAAALRARRQRYDVVFCDLVAHSVAAFSRSPTAVVFYCHYPDKLLGPPRGLLRALYRWPIDELEEGSLRLADRVLVNSLFTARAFGKAYPGLTDVKPLLLYPAVDPGRFASARAGIATDEEILILSISRFEGKKNLGLALDSFARLRSILPENLVARLRLCIAGGYDEGLSDNRRTIRDLRSRIVSLGLGAVADLEPNIGEARKLELLRNARCVIYTPADEHFGYAPVEAMSSGKPVIVADSGGPTETVEQDRTGFVSAPTVEGFSQAMACLVTDPARAAAMGEAGIEHVGRHFSMTAFTDRLAALVDELGTP